MNSKLLLAFLVLSLALAMVTEASKVQDLSFLGTVGDMIGEDNEMMLDSETNRRSLARRRKYISYSALRANSIPCGQRGTSYYSCQVKGRANPYRRGCNRLSNCQRDTS